jgi:DNA-binding response OmpR family regulator
VALPTARIEGPARVLVVADEPLAQLVALALNHGVYEPRCVQSLDDAEELKRSWRPHLLLVDLEIRGGNPLLLIGQRVANRRLPTIAFTRRGDLKMKMAAFEKGADDILTLPFVPEELVARCLAVMRRVYGEAVPFIPIITVGGLEIDMLNQRVRAGSSQLNLTAMEQALLYLLVSNKGRVIDREEILDAIWGTDYVVESNVVDRHIRNLRIKLKDNWRKPRYIGTVPGKGYRFLAQAG